MITRRRLREIGSLSRTKGRREQNAFLIEGVRLLESALDAGVEPVEVIVESGQAGQTRICALLRRVSCPVHHVSARQLEQITEVRNAQGVLAVARCKDDAWLWNPDAHPRILALDGVQDPGNAGTLVRTAAWFDIDGVVAGPGTADLYQPKAVRSAMGGLWDVETARTDDLAGWLVQRKEDGYAVYGTELSGLKLTDWMPGTPSILVLGSEAHGLSTEVARTLDQTITIPGKRRAIHRGVESLNVGAAGAILLEHWTRFD